MRKFRLLLLFFFLALTVPLGYLIWGAHQAMQQEEADELRFFAETLFDRMEGELARLIEREEDRPLDAYAFFSLARDGGLSRSPLGPLPQESYILGYFQNNPDGSIVTPHTHILESLTAGLTPPAMVSPDGDPEADAQRRAEVAGQLAQLNRVFNARRATAFESAELTPMSIFRRNLGMHGGTHGMLPGMGMAEQRRAEAEPNEGAADAYIGLPAMASPDSVEARAAEGGFRGLLAEKYLVREKSRSERVHLGRAKRRTERITLNRAANMARLDKIIILRERGTSASVPPAGRTAHQGFFSTPLPPRPDEEPAPSAGGLTAEASGATIPGVPRSDGLLGMPVGGDVGPRTFQVEVDPFQSVFIDTEHAYIFRRILMNDTVYRQGFVVLVPQLIRHLAARHFANQPMARFTNLKLSVADMGRSLYAHTAGVDVTEPNPTFSLRRNFPRPFSFLHAAIVTDDIPPSKGRATLHLMLFILGAVLLAGFAAIYKSVRVVVDHSEARATFVSSVTHELKTPLTNIKLYVEMMQAGIGGEERRADYLATLGRESQRLARLIDTVLELAKLRGGGRAFSYTEGDFEDVFSGLASTTGEFARREGFTLEMMCAPELGRFSYDREVMVQILGNLVENSVKFGAKCAEKRILVSLAAAGQQQVVVRVTDSGPGVPRHALKKIFEDFYRVEGNLTRATQGTGLGLALVKKLVVAMGGRIAARNNAELDLAAVLRAGGSEMDAANEDAAYVDAADWPRDPETGRLAGVTMEIHLPRSRSESRSS